MKTINWIPKSSLGPNNHHDFPLLLLYSNGKQEFWADKETMEKSDWGWTNYTHWANGHYSATEYRVRERDGRFWPEFKRGDQYGPPEWFTFSHVYSSVTKSLESAKAYIKWHVEPPQDIIHPYP